MNKHLLSVLAAACLLPATLLATDIPVNPSNFEESWAAAADGDVLVMEGGNYNVTFNLQANKTITLRAAEGQEVVLQRGPNIGEQSEQVGLICDGITIHLKSGDHFMRFSAASVKTLEFRNCIIEEIPRCFFYATGNSPIEQIVFQGCTIRECGTKGYCFIWSKACVARLIVSGCTLYNYTDGESFFYQSDRRSNCQMELTFEGNTVSKWGVGDGDSFPFINVTGNLGSQSTYTFRNNIFAESSIKANTPNIITTEQGTVKAQNNLVIGFGTYNASGSAQSQVDDLSAKTLKLKDGPGFPNAMGGDFTLPDGSPLRTAGTDGKAVGDPRWAK